MSQLKDFSIVQNADGIPCRHSDREYYDKAEDILEALPHNQIENLRLEGFGKHFWKDYEAETVPNRNITDLLTPFQNLGELHLSRNAGLVTDEGLQSIISNFPRLQHFSFSGRDELTDYRITGVGPDPKKREKTGVSLDQLTELTTLKIGSCANVHRESLLPVLRFKFLRSFVYDEYFEDWDPTEFLFQVASHNPSLERLNLPDYHDHRMIEKINAAKTKVMKKHPRLRLIRLKYIVDCNA